MEIPKTYVPMNCWKCKAQNNGATAQFCRVCGCLLKTAEPRQDPMSDSFTKHLTFKRFLVSVLAILLTVVAVHFYKGIVQSPHSATANEITLPPNSWYNTSWRSYVSALPSERQILQKYAEAKGNLATSETRRTFSVSGQWSRARGSCFEQSCLAEERKRREKELETLSQKFTIPDGVVKSVGMLKAPEVSDAFKHLDFATFGRFEQIVKAPDKMLRKATARNPAGATYQRLEFLEVFHGIEGKRVVDYFDDADVKVKTQVDVMDTEQVELAKFERESMLGKDVDNYTDVSLLGLKNVNERVAFALAAKNMKGQSDILFFDAITGLLIKADIPGTSVFFEDYRPFGLGVRPYTIYYRRPEIGGFHSWMKFEVEDLKVDEQIDDSVFETPAAD